MAGMRSRCLVLAIAALTLGGCGDDEEEPVAPASSPAATATQTGTATAEAISPASVDADAAEVTRVIQAYLAALADGKGSTACSYLTEGGRDEAAASAGARSCREGAEKVAAGLTDAQKETLATAEVADVEIDGDAATAKLDGARRPVTLQRAAGGTWRISGGFMPGG